MSESEYVERIIDLAAQASESHDIDLFAEKNTNVTPPTMAFSEFLINKEQGDWAELFIKDTVNEKLEGYLAVEYGRSEDKIAGEPGFPEFYRNYHQELADIGKCPDLLVFDEDLDEEARSRIEDVEGVPRRELVEDISPAIAGLEVRSSSYLVDAYRDHQRQQIEEAEAELDALWDEFQTLSRDILNGSPEDEDRIRSYVDKVREYVEASSSDEAPTYRTTSKVKRMARDALGDDAATFVETADRIRQVRKSTFGRSNLSITVKVEDLVVVLNWIRTHGIPHYFVQVFFDGAFILSFADIVELLADPSAKGDAYWFERNEKNQMKYTIHFPVPEAVRFVSDVPYPETSAAVRKHPDGRVQNYVTFNTAPRAFAEGSFDVEDLRRELD